MVSGIRYTPLCYDILLFIILKEWCQRNDDISKACVIIDTNVSYTEAPGVNTVCFNAETNVEKQDIINENNKKILKYFQNVYFPMLS
jgi:hypothetical protein